MKINILFILYITLATFLAPTASKASSLSEARSVLGISHSVFLNQYAPLKWKQQTINLDLESSYNLALNQLHEDMSIRDFHGVLNQYLASTKDAHVVANYIDNEQSKLPFVLHKIGHRFYINEFRGIWRPDYAPMNIGDEVLSIGGESIQKLYQEQLDALGGFADPYYQALATSFVTYQFGYLSETSKGFVNIEFIDYRTGQKKMTNTSWIHTVDKFKFGNKTLNNYQKLYTNNHSEHINDEVFYAPQSLQQSGAGENFYGSGLPGARKSLISYMGAPYNESSYEGFFHSYTYLDKQKRSIGVIRIPSYRPQDPISAIVEFRDKINFFQKNTDALIIDQLSNQGGYLFFMYSILSVLTDRPLDLPKHKVALSSKYIETIFSFKQKLNKISTVDQLRDEFTVAVEKGLHIDMSLKETALDFSNQILKNYNENKKISDPVALWGFNKIKPDPSVQYNKPIVVLINELNMSGGDFLPAILKDNKRAFIFGKKTFGAGGVVKQFSVPNSLGLRSISYTTSLAIRSNGEIIENKGVKPDFSYNIKVEDIRTGFELYKKALGNYLENILTE